jgi:hypothetical protein
MSSTTKGSTAGKTKKVPAISDKKRRKLEEKAAIASRSTTIDSELNEPPYSASSTMDLDTSTTIHSGDTDEEENDAEESDSASASVQSDTNDDNSTSTTSISSKRKTHVQLRKVVRTQLMVLITDTINH